jgi:parvulin-like peptidyl-prolyl isomerase
MKRIALGVLFFVFSAVFGFSQSDLQPAAIVKLTKTEQITVKQFRTEVERMEKTAGRTLNESEKKQVLDAMINERLALQAADRDKITVAESEINQQIQQLRDGLTQRAGRTVTDAEFARAIRDETGLEMSAFREQARRQLIVQKYMMSKKQNLVETFKEPTDAEILDMYNLTKAQFVRPDTVRFSYIRIPYGSDRIKAKELADRLYRDVGSNSSKFNEVAMKGQIANSGYQSGDGGYLPRMMEAQQLLGAEFVSAAFTLKIEEVSKLMESSSGQFTGYQFIKVTESYSMKNLELDDIYRLGVPMTVKDTIRYSLFQERQQKLLAQMTEELITELRAGGKTFEIFNRNLGW